MGQYLSAPVTDKETLTGQFYAVSSMQGEEEGGRAADKQALPLLLSSLLVLLGPDVLLLLCTAAFRVQPVKHHAASPPDPAFPICVHHSGWRKNHEDAHIAHHFSEDCHLFGVFDGHGGPEVRRAAEALHGRSMRCCPSCIANV